jgi:hypothetical protein
VRKSSVNGVQTARTTYNFLGRRVAINERATRTVRRRVHRRSSHLFHPSPQFFVGPWEASKLLVDLLEQDPAGSHCPFRPFS